MEMKEEIDDILKKGGVKPTPNRILVVEALLSAGFPMSLVELETELRTVERSSISRVLNLLHEHEVVHTMEDGRGIVKYELCHCADHASEQETHAHFYCESCEKVYCLENITIPSIDVPEGYELKSINFMLKGLCPKCKGKGQR